jgi:alkylresorcinol/alkylpyrone synthase
LALATAVPPFPLEQPEVAKRVEHLFGAHRDIQRMIPIFANSGIARRYSCVPVDWYEHKHGWKERNALYIENAVSLLERVTLALLKESDLSRDAIDAIVCVSSTGIATPSLDALLMERMGLRRDVQRMPVFGLGCAGGVMGLSSAADAARASPGRLVLFLVVELCGLTFRKDDLSKSNIVATALFGDGAAGALISTGGEGPELGAGGQHTWPNALDVMGWDVEADGLRPIFATSIPNLVEHDMRAIVDRFLEGHDLARSDIDLFASHPGGAKVLTALEDAFELAPGALVDSRATLNDFGNMSAATVLFVLARMAWRKPQQRILLTSMGPGFSAAFQLLGGR